MDLVCINSPENQSIDKNLISEAMFISTVVPCSHLFLITANIVAAILPPIFTHPSHGKIAVIVMSHRHVHIVQMSFSVGGA